MNQYFHNMINGIQTVFEGMSITLASMFQGPATVEYPDVDVRSVDSIRVGLKGKRGYKGNLRGMPENYRGILDVDMSICTACLICMKACPIDCIAITNVKCDKRKLQGKNGKPAAQTRAATRFDIDIAKCMFCGLCVEPCPTGAIFHTNEFEMNRDNLEGLILRFVAPEEAEKASKRAAEIAVEQAEKKAALAKEKAAAKGEDS